MKGKVEVFFSNTRIVISEGYGIFRAVDIDTDKVIVEEAQTEWEVWKELKKLGYEWKCTE